KPCSASSAPPSSSCLSASSPGTARIGTRVRSPPAVVEVDRVRPLAAPDHAQLHGSPNLGAARNDHPRSVPPLHSAIRRPGNGLRAGLPRLAAVLPLAGAPPQCPRDGSR